MSTRITCPSCSTQFEPTDALRDEIQRELRNQMRDWQKKKEEEFLQREAKMQDLQKQLEESRQHQEEELVKRLDQEKKQLEEKLSLQIRKSVSGEYDVQLRQFQQLLQEKDARLTAARQAEMEVLQLKEQLQSKEQELDLRLKRSLLEERQKLEDSLRKQEEERSRLRDQEYQMKMRELEKQLEDQRRLAEEMKRKAEQGSMQLQGEVQELALESLLRNAFPFDVVEEVGKGVRGADCILTVRNNFGQVCGRIIFESKRTKDFSNDWVEKLKGDARSLSADIAVIVTQAMPKDMECFGEKDGVWVCNFGEVRALVSVLRDLVIRVFNAAQTQENKGDKMQMLYSYLTSNEFSEQWRAIREGFMSMRLSIQKERDAMERLWKAREKQLEKVLLNAAHIKGSIEGISGMETVDLNLLEEGATLLD